MKDEISDLKYRYIVKKKTGMKQGYLEEISLFKSFFVMKKGVKGFRVAFVVQVSLVLC